MSQRRAAITRTGPGWSKPLPWSDQQVWYERTQDLFGSDLADRPDADWKTIYEELEPVVGYKNPFTPEVLADPTAVEILLELGYDPSLGDDWALRVAIANDNVESVRLLLADNRVDPSSMDNNAIKTAAERGNVDIVDYLLLNPRTDPGVDNNYPLEIAAQSGHYDVVDLLLRDDRVSIDDTVHLRSIADDARANGYYDIADLIDDTIEAPHLSR